MKVIDLIDTLLKLLNSSLKPVILDLPEARLEIPIQLLSASKERARINWVPRYSMTEKLKRSAILICDLSATRLKAPEPRS